MRGAPLIYNTVCASGNGIFYKLYMNFWPLITQIRYIWCNSQAYIELVYYIKEICMHGIYITVKSCCNG